MKDFGIDFDDEGLEQVANRFFEEAECKRKNKLPIHWCSYNIQLGFDIIHTFICLLGVEIRFKIKVYNCKILAFGSKNEMDFFFNLSLQNFALLIYNHDHFTSMVKWFV